MQNGGVPLFFEVLSILRGISAPRAYQLELDKVKYLNDGLLGLNNWLENPL